MKQPMYRRRLASRTAVVLAVLVAYALASTGYAAAQGTSPRGDAAHGASVQGAPVRSAAAQGGSVQAAAQDSAAPTSMIIVPSAPFTVGTPVTVTVQLTTTSTEVAGALANEALELWVDGVPERRTRTDETGRAEIRISSELPVGSHSLRVVYKGSRALAGSEATATAVVEPAALTIQTVPALAGVVFRLGSQEFQSGSDGIARINVDKPGTYPLEVITTDVKMSNTHARFSRWADDQYKETRQVDIPQDETLQAGFDVSYRFTWSYHDLDGQPVDPLRASAITVKGTHGSSHTFDDHEPQWLLGSRVVRLKGGLQEARIQWGVENVIVDGANTVNRGQHRFYLQPDDEWRIQLLLYTANFSARDAFFGFPVGSGFKLEYPDGQVRYFPSGPDRRATAAALARGQYSASIADAPGIAPAAPVAITRHQDVQLKVISYFDLAVAGLALGSIGLGLLFFGRPHLLAWVPTPLRRKNSRMAPVWTTGALLLVLIGIPTLTTSYLLTVRLPDRPSTPAPVMSSTGGKEGNEPNRPAGLGAAVLPPLPVEAGSAAPPREEYAGTRDGRAGQ